MRLQCQDALAQAEPFTGLKRVEVENLLESWRDDEVIQTDSVEYYGKVVEARGGAGGVRLVLEGGIEVMATDITALRVPPS